MIRKILLFIYAWTRGIYPICDRCKDYHKKSTRINFWLYMKNSKGEFVYCTPCWNWIHLKKWTDKDGHYHTLRSEGR